MWNEEEAKPLSLQKSIWELIKARLQAWGQDLGKLFETRKGVDSVDFSISFIALAAKLAKADGQVTRNEVAMFRSIFVIPREEEKNAGRVYDLCRQDVAGFESYARKLANALRDDAFGEQIKLDVLDGLFHIAMADDEFHEAEEAFLETVAAIFEVAEEDYISLLARHVPDREDPWHVLGVTRDASQADVKRAWRALVKENHPDILMARGLPAEMIELATSRITSINKAYETVSAGFPQVVCPGM